MDEKLYKNWAPPYPTQSEELHKTRKMSPPVRVNAHKSANLPRNGTERFANRVSPEGIRRKNYPNL